MRQATGGLLALVAVGVLIVTVQLAVPAAPSHDRSRAFEAWAQSLTSRAQYEAERARVQRAQDAWTERLTRQAEYELRRNAPGMSERAKKAWSDRLNALAEHFGATDNN